MTLVNAVDSSYRKIHAQRKRDTDTKIAAAAAGHGAGKRILELLEMEKQREQLVPLQEERERVQAATEVLVIACLKEVRTPALEFDDWLSTVETQTALSE